MNVKIEEISSIARKLHFEIGAERVDQEIEGAFRKIGKTKPQSSPTTTIRPT